jgi:hypothetical protein
MPASPNAWRPPPAGADVSEATRAALIAEFGVFSPGEAARRAGSKGHSPTLAVKRWQAANKIFAVPVAGSDHFLGFCFDSSGRPRPAIGSILRSVAGRSSGWDLAMWFAAPNERLGGVRPVDALDGDGQRLAAAAAADMAAPDDQPPPQ